MLQRICCFAAIFIMCGCGSDLKAPSDAVNAVQDSSAAPVDYPYKNLERIYEGDFGGSGSIRIALRHVTGRQAVGYSLHKGLRRNITGKMSHKGDKFHFLLHEPGDNPYDGIFDFTVDKTSYKLQGTWKPNNEKSASAKSYSLQPLQETDNNENPMSVADYWSELQLDTTRPASNAEYYFDKDGTARYRYFPGGYENARSQYQEIKGNWRINGDTLKIDWASNDKIPMHMVMLSGLQDEAQGDEFYNRQYKGSGRVLVPAGMF